MGNRMNSRMKNARVWLKKAIAEEDARRADSGMPAPDPRTVPTEPAPPVEEPAVDVVVARWRDKFAHANGKLRSLAPTVASLVGESAPAIQEAYLSAVADAASRLPTPAAISSMERWSEGAPEALTKHPAWALVTAALTARRAALAEPREPGEEG